MSGRTELAGCDELVPSSKNSFPVPLGPVLVSVVSREASDLRGITAQSKIK